MTGGLRNGKAAFEQPARVQHAKQLAIPMRGKARGLPEAPHEMVLRESRFLREIVERRGFAEAAREALHRAPDAGVVAAAHTAAGSGLRAAKDQLGGRFR